jgi:hypothetical protein
MDLEWRLNMVTADRNLLENNNAKLEADNTALLSEAAALRSKVEALQSEVEGLRELALVSGRRAMEFEALTNEAFAAASQLQADKEALECELRGWGGGAAGGPARQGSSLSARGAGGAAARVAAALSSGGSGIPSPGSGGASRRTTPRPTTAHDHLAPPAAAAAGSFTSTPRDALAGAPAGLHPLRTGSGCGSFAQGAASGAQSPSSTASALHGRAPSLSGASAAAAIDSSPRARAAALLSAGAAFSEQLQSKTATNRSPGGTPRRGGGAGLDMISALRTSSGFVSAAPAAAPMGVGLPVAAGGGILSAASSGASRIPASPSTSARSSAGGGGGGGGGGLRGSMGGALSALYTAPAGAHLATEPRAFCDDLRRSSGGLPLSRAAWPASGGAEAPAPGRRPSGCSRLPSARVTAA